MSGDDYFLYAATAYFGLNAAVFSCAPAMPATDSFGPEAAECAPLPRRGDRPPRTPLAPAAPIRAAGQRWQSD